MYNCILLLIEDFYCFIVFIDVYDGFYLSWIFLSRLNKFSSGGC